MCGKLYTSQSVNCSSSQYLLASTAIPYIIKTRNTSFANFIFPLCSFTKYRKTLTSSTFDHIPWTLSSILSLPSSLTKKSKLLKEFLGERLGAENNESLHYLVVGWTNPFEKYAQVKMGGSSSPIFEVKMPKNIWVATTHFRILTPRWCHHQDSYSSRESQAEAIHFRHTRTQCPTCVVNLPNMRSIGILVYRNVKMSLFLVEGLVK